MATPRNSPGSHQTQRMSKDPLRVPVSALKEEDAIAVDVRKTFHVFDGKMCHEVESHITTKDLAKSSRCSATSEYFYLFVFHLFIYGFLFALASVDSATLSLQPSYDLLFSFFFFFHFVPRHIIVQSINHLSFFPFNHFDP